MRTSLEIVMDLDAFAGAEPPPVSWVSGVDAEAGIYYCPDCAKKAADSYKNADFESGMGGEESDGCAHCDTCGCLLSYSLTDYGVMEELDHFKENPPIAPLSQEEAYHIARMVAGAGDDNAEAIAIGEAAVAKITTRRLNEHDGL